MFALRINQKQGLRILHVAVVFASFAYIFSVVNWSQAFYVLHHMDLKWVGLALVCSFLTLAPMAKRLSYLFHVLLIPYSFFSAYTTYLMGAFASLALPGVIGGDALRIWQCSRNSSATVILASSVVVAERLLGVLSLIILLNLGLHSGESILLPFSDMVSLLTVIPVLAIILLPWLLHVLFAKRSVKNKWLNIFLAKTEHIRGQLALLRAIKMSHLSIGLGLTLLAQLLDACTTYLLALGLGFNVSLQAIMIVLPLTYLVIILPISPGGLGVRESAFVTMLTWFHVPASEAALLALAVFFTRVLIGLAGGLNMVVSRS